MVLEPATNVDRPLRVTIISQGHPALSIGGSERSALSLFENLKAAGGVTPTFVARAEHSHLGHDGHFGRYRGRADEILWVPPPIDHFRLVSRSPDRLRQQVSELLADTQPDVVHVHHYGGFGADIFRIVSEEGRVPVVATLHEYLAICNNHGQMVRVAGGLCEEEYYSDCHACYPEYSSGKFFLRKQHLMACFASVSRCIAPSRFLADRYIAWGLPPERVVVAENPLPANGRAEPKAVRPSRNGRPLVLGFFGQVNPFKGVDILLDALLLAQAALPPGAVELALFGANLDYWQPDFRAAIEQKIAALGPVVKRRGAYRNEEVFDLMRRVDWVVVPSIWWENSPVVIQEAKAAGVPVLCSNIGGMAEKVLPGRDGIHFKAGDARDLADRVVALAGGDGVPLVPVPVPQEILTSAIVETYRVATASA